MIIVSLIGKKGSSFLVLYHLAGLINNNHIDTNLPANDTIVIEPVRHIKYICINHFNIWKTIKKGELYYEFVKPVNG